MLTEDQPAAPTARAVDPITVEVVRQTITAIGDEMEANITRTALSPIVYEFKDFCAALLDAEGRIIGQAMGSLPMFLGDLGNAIEDILKVYGAHDIAPGDIFASNDPIVFGQHLNNVVITLPLFHEGALIAYSAVRAHWVDIGGRDPGGWNPDTTEVYQEGLQIPTLKLYKRGVLDDEIARLIALNIRTPESVFGDIRAQVAACHLGGQRFLQTIDKYGWPTVRACIDTIWDQAEQRTRREIAAIPDGTYEAESFLDDDGVRHGQPVRLKARAIVQGSDLTVDLSDIADQVVGPLNSGAATAMTVARTVVKMIASPLEVANDGSSRPVHVILPEGKLLSARRPAALAQWSAALPTLMDTLLAALSQAIPRRVPAGSRNDVAGCKVVSPPGSARPYYYSHSAPGGWGAMPYRDGLCGMLSLGHGDSKIFPTEVVEAEGPIRIDQVTLIEDSGGAGQYRGGLGQRRTVRVLQDGRGTFNMHRSGCPPWGLHGGQAGARDLFHVEIPGQEPFAIPRAKDLDLPEGAVVHMDTAGGGGWGSPLDRDPAIVAADVAEGYVSPAAARAVYGVVLDAAGHADLAATAALRARPRERQREAGA